MAKKTKSKQTAAHVVTLEERVSLAQRASLRRAVGIERTIKALRSALVRLRNRNRLDELSLAADIAKDRGYQLERPKATE